MEIAFLVSERGDSAKGNTSKETEHRIILKKSQVHPQYLKGIAELSYLQESRK